MLYYSASAGGFFDPEIHGAAIPADAVAVTREQHALLLQGQSEGLRIEANAAGLPVLVQPPPAPAAVPSKISRAQGRLALFRAGLWPQVLAYVDAIEDPAEQFEADNALNHTTDWERASPFLARAAGALGLSAEALDGLFIEAAKIVP